MTKALGVFVGVCIALVCVLAVLLNPGLGVLVLLLALLAGIYAFRTLGGRAARARRKRNLNKKRK